MRRALALSATLVIGACSSSNVGPGGYPCTGATSFLAFAPGSQVSAIPLCDDATDAGEVAAEARYGPPPLEIDGGSGYPFAGAPSLSDEGLEQCSLICSTATYRIPCCQSQWEPETIVCSPACP
jgi:hypothetical protein